MVKKHISRTDQLFGETESVTASFAKQREGVQRYIPLQDLVPSRFNPRRAYSREDLEELIHSMKVFGFVGALDGRALPDGRVELAYGSRRLLAAKAINLRHIPVFLHDWDDAQMRLLTLIENSVHKSMTPADEADLIGYLNSELGLTVHEICQQLGKAQAWVQDRLVLHNAPEDVKQMVAMRPDTLRSARYVARLPDKAGRLTLRDTVLSRALGTHQIEAVVQQIERGCSIDEALTAGARAQSESTETELPQPTLPIAEAVIAAAGISGPSELAPREGIDSTPTGARSAESLSPGSRKADQSQLQTRARAADHQIPVPSRKSAQDGDSAAPSQIHSQQELAVSSQLLALAIDALDSFDPAAVEQQDAAKVMRTLSGIGDRAAALEAAVADRLE